MHELGIVFHIIESLEQIGVENNLHRVSSVTLEVGEVSTVVPDSLMDCWKWSVTKTLLLKDSLLKFEILSAVTHCDTCGKSHATVEYGKVCPHCQSEDTYLITGNEVNIKEIEAM